MMNSAERLAFDQWYDDLFAGIGNQNGQGLIRQG